MVIENKVVLNDQLFCLSTVMVMSYESLSSRFSAIILTDEVLIISSISFMNEV